MPEISAGAPSVRIWTNARLATMAGPRLGIVAPGAIAVRDGRIVYVGPPADLPHALAGGETVDCDGRWITPGLIDCHTHLVWAGDRADEFERRLAGASYEALAQAGGGIASSVRSLRAASEDTLVCETLPRLDALIAEGVTTVEVKSGYGLDLANEVKSLRVARRLAAERPVAVRTTFLGAHALPPDVDDRDAVVDGICAMVPVLAAAGLVDAVDGFCERIAFTAAEIARVFDVAQACALPVKLHADQLSDAGGATLAARYGALSADHLEYADAGGVAAMAAAGTVAVMLPGAFYFIRERQVPPVALLRARGVPLAVATDANPGTSPLTSLLLAMNMAATLFGLTVDECLLGVTRNAARALGLAGVGTLEVGQRADLAIWSIERPAELVYRMGFNPLHARVWGGR